MLHNFSRISRYLLLFTLEYLDLYHIFSCHTSEFLAFLTDGNQLYVWLPNSVLVNNIPVKVFIWLFLFVILPFISHCAFVTCFVLFVG